MKKSLQFGGLLLAFSFTHGLANAQDDRKGVGTLGVDPLFPSGQVGRYAVPHFKSRSQANGQPSTSVISITNNSPGPCSVAVDWQYGLSATTCTTAYNNLPSGFTVNLCTRSISTDYTTCDVVCSPSLDFVQGRARVFSTNTTACSKIAVDARVYHLNNDGSLAAISNSKVVKFGGANVGD